MRIQCIKHITSPTTLQLGARFSEQICNHSFSSVSITLLTLRNNDKVSIKYFASISPSLQELMIGDNFKLTATEDNIHDLTGRFTKLWKLNSIVNSLNQSCLNYLKSAAPNIRERFISVYDKKGMSKITIDISEWALKQLDVMLDPNWILLQHCNIAHRQNNQIRYK